MTDHVKRFIEENIEFIEEEDWRGVFLSWYLHYGSGNNVQDLKYVNELFNVLEQAFPNVKTDSHDDRMEIIVDNFVDYIHMKESDPNVTRIQWGGGSDYLLSGLGFQEENKSHFRTAAKQCGYIIKGPLLVFNIR